MTRRSSGRSTRPRRARATSGLITAAVFFSCVSCSGRNAAKLDREIARIGAPLPGAQPVGKPHSSGGNVICVDACLERTQGYVPSGSMDAFLAAGTTLLRARGYAVSRSGCTELGPGTMAEDYELSCAVSGERGGLRATVKATSPLDRPIITPECPQPPSDCDLAEPPSGVMLDQAHGDTVDVSVT
jgi:hypothetical protein